MATLSGVRLVWVRGAGDPEVVAEWRLEGDAARLVSGEGTSVAGEIEDDGLDLAPGDAAGAQEWADRYGFVMPDRAVLRAEDGAALLAGILATYKSGASRMWAEPVEGGA